VTGAEQERERDRISDERDESPTIEVGARPKIEPGKGAAGKVEPQRSRSRREDCRLLFSS